MFSGLGTISSETCVYKVIDTGREFIIIFWFIGYKTTSDEYLWSTIFNGKTAIGLGCFYFIPTFR